MTEPQENKNLVGETVAAEAEKPVDDLAARLDALEGVVKALDGFLAAHEHVHLSGPARMIQRSPEPEEKTDAGG